MTAWAMQCHWILRLVNPEITQVVTAMYKPVLLFLMPLSRLSAGHMVNLLQKLKLTVFTELHH